MNRKGAKQLHEKTRGVKLDLCMGRNELGIGFNHGQVEGSGSFLLVSYGRERQRVVEGRGEQRGRGKEELSLWML
ncbi:hypothetical protein SDJN03_01027, partial [Cucurbita argyrosperma subsp. sororia]